MNTIDPINSFIIEASGAITSENAQDFEAVLTQGIQSSISFNCLVNMEKVDFLDSTGLLVLLSAFRLAQGLGKQLSFYSLTPTVRIIFDLTQLDRVFTLLDGATHWHFEAN